jgi:hypothetical protein
MQSHRLKTYLSRALLVAAISAMPLSAQASITIFSAQDDGVSTAGPFPNSDGAQSSFLGAASVFGPVTTEKFQEFAPGAGGFGGTLPISGGHVTLTTDFGIPYGGVNNDVSSNVYGFPLPGETNWLGFSGGSATFAFNGPSNSFGFYTTGVQTVFTSSFTVTFNDGTSQSLDIPINVNGGASYFGFTDTSAFNSVTITNISGDAWGVSDVSYNFTQGVPEPATWALFIAGFGAMGAMLRAARRKALPA